MTLVLGRELSGKPRWAMVSVPVLLFLTAMGVAQERVELLMEGLKDSSFKVRLKSAIMLGRSNDGRAVGDLVSSLRDENYFVRGASARALGNLGLPLASEAILPLLRGSSDPEIFVQREIVDALKKLASAETLEPFITALRNEERSIRWTAVKVLAQVELSDARDALVTALGDLDASIQEEALVVIRKRVPEERDRLVEKALGRFDNYRIQAAAVTLISEQKVFRFIDNLGDLLTRDDVVMDVKQAAVRALREMKGRLNLANLVEQLSSEDRQVQGRAIILLGVSGDPQAVDALLKLLNHTDSFVRRKTVFALGDAGDPRAIPALEALLKKEENERFQEEIRRTLRKLKP